MITYFQAIIIGLLQGVSELFPVSSLGHSVILPQLLGWDIHQQDSFFITFLVATHLATAIVLVGFYWNDWIRIVKGMGISLAAREVSPKNTAGKLGWLLVMGTIPAAILGLLLQDPLRAIFASSRSAAFFLILNGIMLYGAELLRRKSAAKAESSSDERITQLSWTKSIFIGAAQAIALIPGFSRSGTTMAGSLLVGLNNEDAARFSFLMATPIIGGAAILKLPDLFTAANHPLLGPALVGALCAGFTAYLSVRFLVKYFSSNKLTPFAVYCIIAGITFSLMLWAK